jgi:DNA primase
MREQLQRIGLYRETGREHFNGSIVFPVEDENGVVSEVYARRLKHDSRTGIPKHLYLPGAHVGVFNAQAFTATDEIILCECIIDALTFWRWGFRHVTCSYGTNGFTDEILQAFIDNKTKRVLIAYDRDEAGNTTAEKLAPTLLENGIDAFRILLPKNMDVNQYALQVTPAHDVQGSTSAASAGRAGAVKRLALVIRKAEWLGNGKPPERQLELTELQTKNVEPQDQERSDTSKTPVKPASNEQEEIAKLNPIDQAASPLPPLAASVDVQTTDTETLITLGDRVYRVRGLANNNHLDQLKINLMVKRDEQFHLDKLDLYSSKQRQVFINQSCVDPNVA